LKIVLGTNNWKLEIVMKGKGKVCLAVTGQHFKLFV